jgi:trk system potassium uptake protein TrkH
MLNVGGMKLLKAETPGPVKDDKLSPRVSSTAHYLWGVYIFITLACIMAYYIGGMSLFDAVAHSFTTVSTGGFSTHDASMGYFNSHTLLWISNLFMVLGAINFGLHFRVFRHRDYSGYFRDEETRVFLIIILVLSVLVAGYLFFEDTYTNLFESMSYSTFHIISFITSTGYGASGFTEWPAAATCVLIMTGYLGGCAGSTAGGNKIIRNILTVKIFNRSLKQMIHPHGKFAIKYQRSPVQTEVRSAVMAFMSFSAISTIIITLMLMTTGLDFWSSLSAVAACVNVLGPGFGQLGTNFAPVTDAGTWLLSGAMILGRLEYFTVFAIFSPMFWKD